VSWEETQISIPRDGGPGANTVTISAGSFGLSDDPRIFIGWIPYETDFRRYTTANDAEEAEAIVMAVYRGNHNIRPIYGTRIVDGSKVRPKSIRRSEIEANAISDDEVEEVSAEKLKRGTLDMERVPSRGVATKYIAASAITKGAFTRNGGEVAITSTSDSADLFDDDVVIEPNEDGEGRIVAFMQFRVVRNNTNTSDYEGILASNVWDFVFTMYDGNDPLDSKTISLPSATRVEVTSEGGGGEVLSMQDRYMANSNWMTVMFISSIQGRANLNVRARRAASSDFGFDMGARELFVQLFDK
jgi:hypothetical protein